MLAFVATTFICQAQLFVGGNIGVKFNGGNVDYSIVSPIVNEEGTQYLDRKTSFEIAPMVGYQLSDNMSVGLRLGYTNTTNKSCSDNFKDDYNIKSTTLHYGFAPFFRYTVFSHNNFKIFADAELPISFATEKNVVEGSNATVEVDAPKQFNIGILIVPGLMYEITENISFVSELGLLNLGYIHQRTKVSEDITPESTMTYVQKNNQFGIGINNHVQATIGFIYTF